MKQTNSSSFPLNNLRDFFLHLTFLLLLVSAVKPNVERSFGWKWCDMSTLQTRWSQRSKKWFALRDPMTYWHKWKSSKFSVHLQCKRSLTLEEIFGCLQLHATTLQANHHQFLQFQALLSKWQKQPLQPLAVHRSKQQPWFRPAHKKLHINAWDGCSLFTKKPH